MWRQSALRIGTARRLTKTANLLGRRANFTEFPIYSGTVPRTPRYFVLTRPRRRPFFFADSPRTSRRRRRRPWHPCPLKFVIITIEVAKFAFGHSQTRNGNLGPAGPTRVCPPESIEVATELIQHPAVQTGKVQHCQGVTIVDLAACVSEQRSTHRLLRPDY